MEETFEALITNADSDELVQTQEALRNQNYVNDLTKSINKRLIDIIDHELGYRSHLKHITQ